MSKKITAKTYGQILINTQKEGLAYYLTNYENPANLDFDKELQEAFINARDSLSKFIDLIEERIEENGGSIEDYEY